MIITHKTKTLTIFDWDDTLFPTTWAIKNNILKKNNMVDESAYFKLLDNTVYNMLKKIVNVNSNKIIIVTNASEKWVYKCIKVMPLTKNITQNIKIYSSREMFQKDYPSDNYMWKKLFFEHIINDYYFNRNYKKNVISIGDAEYEYFALINLFLIPKNKISSIKTVKLSRFPTKETLINEVKLLEQFLPRLMSATENSYDIHFINKEN